MVSKTTKHLRRIQVAAILILLPLLFAFSTFAAFADSNNNEAKANLTPEITQKLLSEADLSERVMYDLYDATIKEERYYDRYECWGEPPREQCRMVRDYYTVEVSLDEEQFNKSLPKLTAYPAFVKDLDNTYQPAANSSKLVKDSWVKLMEQNKLLSAELAILASKPDLETLQEHRDKFKRNVLKMCDLAYTVHNNKKPRRPKSKTFPFPLIVEPHF
jgi:hypothetical protein